MTSHSLVHAPLPFLHSNTGPEKQAAPHRSSHGPRGNAKASGGGPGLDSSRADVKARSVNLDHHNLPRRSLSSLSKPAKQRLKHAKARQMHSLPPRATMPMHTLLNTPLTHYQPPLPPHNPVSCTHNPSFHQHSLTFRPLPPS